MMENNDELCGGVKILIERMKSNPEEFTDIDSTIGTHKWNGVMSSSMWDKDVTCWDDVLTPAEVDALRKARSNIMRAKFTNLVMARLLKDQEETKTTSPFPSGGYFVSSGVGGGGTGGQGLMVNLPPFQTIGAVTSDTSIYTSITQSKPKSFWGSFLKGMAGR
jgi:hypothetical protein